jgi:hypothetical protein
MQASEEQVDWAYEIWDDLLAGLTSADNHDRAIAGQVLCNLAKCDPQARILRDFDALMKVTYDERFVTARHVNQNLYKIGAVSDAHKARLLDGWEARYFDADDEKNCTLIRHDILVGMRELYNLAPDEEIRTRARTLIDQEPDAKYRKKYAAVWNK